MTYDSWGVRLKLQSTDIITMFVLVVSDELEQVEKEVSHAE